MWCGQGPSRTVSHEGGGMWTGIVQLRIWTSSGIQQWTFGVHKRRGISWLAERLCVICGETPCLSVLFMTLYPNMLSTVTHYQTILLPVTKKYAPLSLLVADLQTKVYSKCLFVLGDDILACWRYFTPKSWQKTLEWWKILKEERHDSSHNER
jgi:hypothetical protein